MADDAVHPRIALKKGREAVLLLAGIERRPPSGAGRIEVTDERQPWGVIDVVGTIAFLIPFGTLALVVLHIVWTALTGGLAP